MRNLIRRFRLWWAGTQMTAEDHAVRAWETSHMHRTYRRLLRCPQAMTRVIALNAHDMSLRHRN